MPARIIGARETNSSFRLKFNNSTGTCFAYHTAKGTCLVSAAHCLEGAQAGDDFGLQKADGTWHQFKIDEIQFGDKGYDVCAFSTKTLSLGKMLPEYNANGVMLGDELKFIGFPHDLVNTHPGKYFAIPLIRTAFFSGVVDQAGIKVMVLDGFNNPGYSGSPIYYKDDAGQIGCIGVVSGYRFEVQAHSKLFASQGGIEIEVPNMYTKPNSGMILAVPGGEMNKTVEKLTRFLPVGPDSGSSALTANDLANHGGEPGINLLK